MPPKQLNTNQLSSLYHALFYHQFCWLDVELHAGPIFFIIISLWEGQRDGDLICNGLLFKAELEHFQEPGTVSLLHAWQRPNCLSYPFAVFQRKLASGVKLGLSPKHSNVGRRQYDHCQSPLSDRVHGPKGMLDNCISIVF